MPKADRQLTEQAKFIDPRSFVYSDGREWLYEKDWKARKRQLWERCGGICEEIVPFSSMRCWHEAVHPHHIIKKSIAHDDRLNNLMGICEEHHRLRHPEKQPKWSRR